jgi:hypothetical protein
VIWGPSASTPGPFPKIEFCQSIGAYGQYGTAANHYYGTHSETLPKRQNQETNMTILTLAIFAGFILTTSIWAFGRLDREGRLLFIEDLDPIN